jgi:hypothetical protein
MSILNFDGTSGRKSGKPFKVILGIGALAAVVAVASTLAANININSGPVEFGQGVAQTTACDDSITVTPRSQFINSIDSETVGTQVVTVGSVAPDAFIVKVEDRNLFYVGMPIVFESGDVLTNDPTEVVSIESETTTADIGYPYFEGITDYYVVTVADQIFDGPGQTTVRVGGSGFQFSGVDVSDIDATEGKCRGKTFTLKAYGETETAALATYSVLVGENGFLSGDGSIESSNEGTSSSSFSLEFISTRISASSVYKITIESSEYVQILLDGRTFDVLHIGITGGIIEQGLPLAQCSNGVCTAYYIRGDSLGARVDTQIVLNRNPSGTANKEWTFTEVYSGESFDTYGYIKYFNGTYGVFQQTADEMGDILPENQIQIVFSTSGALPAPSEPSEEFDPLDPEIDLSLYLGTLTWSYPSESRYTE